MSNGSNGINLIPSAEPAITDRELQNLMSYCLRSPSVYQAAREINLEQLLPGNAPEYVRVVWGTACRLVDESDNQFPQNLHDRLVADITSQASNLDSPEVLLSPLIAPPDQNGDRSGGALDAIFDRPQEEIAATVSYGLDLLKKLARQQSFRQLKVFVDNCDRKIPDEQSFAETLRAIRERQDQVNDTIGSIDNEQTFVLQDRLPAYNQRLAQFRGHRLVGLKTGMQSLDNRLLGIRGLTILGAGPGVGKTVLTLQLSLGVCQHFAENNAVVLYISLDMPSDDILDRIHCRLAGMDWKTFKLGSEQHRLDNTQPIFTEAQFANIQRSHELMAQWELGTRFAMIGRDDTGHFSASKIVNVVRRLKQRNQAANCLVVIDYLQLLPIDEKGESDLEKDRKRFRLAQQILDDINRDNESGRNAMLLITEARKPSRSNHSGRDDWGMDIESLMGSARLGYGADAVLLMRRLNSDEQSSLGLLRSDGSALGSSADEMEAAGKSLLEFHLAKGRDGMTRGKWPAEFHFRESWISDEVSWHPSDEQSSLSCPRTLRTSQRDRTESFRAVASNFQDGID